MTADNFRFAPACFVGNPAHHAVVIPVIAKYDEAYQQKFGSKQYVPACMKDPEWAQSNVYFAVALSNGVHQLKVFSQN